MFVDAQGNEYQPYRWLTFNDVLLKPQRSPFKSRNDKSIILSSLLSANLRIDIPIISSNMDTITGVDMAIEMNRLGGLGILHRFYPTLDDYFAKIVDVYERSNEGLCKQKRVAFSIGCGSQWIDFVRLIIERVSPEFPHEIIVCLDVAHGHMEQSVEMVGF
jgi:IMP dehydrogenase